jgi:anaerobic selenocysteine-containing dehydrogenase
VTVDQATGRAVKMQGDPSHPVTRGFLCGKVAKYLDRVYSPDRLLYPMRRRVGAPKGPAGYGAVRGREADAFERITWDEALDEIAAKLKKIAAEFGPESVLPYSYAGTIGQLGYGSMDRRFFHRLGASLFDSRRSSSEECVWGKAGDDAAGLCACGTDHRVGCECPREQCASVAVY